MTTCLTSLGDGIAKGMQMMAMALSAQPPNSTAHPAPRAPQVYPHINTYNGFPTPFAYENIYTLNRSYMYLPILPELTVKKWHSPPMYADQFWVPVRHQKKITALGVRYNLQIEKIQIIKKKKTFLVLQFP